MDETELVIMDGTQLVMKPTILGSFLSITDLYQYTLRQLINLLKLASGLNMQLLTQVIINFEKYCSYIMSLSISTEVLICHERFSNYLLTEVLKIHATYFTNAHRVYINRINYALKCVHMFLHMYNVWDISSNGAYLTLQMDYSIMADVCFALTHDGWYYYWWSNTTAFYPDWFYGLASFEQIADIRHEMTRIVRASHDDFVNGVTCEYSFDKVTTYVKTHVDLADLFFF